MSVLHLCGAGNSEAVRLALAVQAATGRWQRIVLLDDDTKKHGRKILGVPVAGPFDLLGRASPHEDEVVNLVARTTPGRSAARQRIAKFEIPFASLVSPGVDTFGADLDPGVLVYPRATVGPEVTIGTDSVVFMGAIAGHESRVGPGCVLAANSVLSARVVLGECVYVGTNATLLPEVTVGPGATIGAGAVVFGEVPAGATVMPPRSRVVGPPTRVHAPSKIAPRRPGRSDLERRLGQIWRELLRIDEVHSHDNFFDLGGSSLLALHLRDRIEQETAIDLDVIEVFRFPSIGALANRLAADAGGVATSSVGAARAALRQEARRHT